MIFPDKVVLDTICLDLQLKLSKSKGETDTDALRKMIERQIEERMSENVGNRKINKFG